MPRKFKCALCKYRKCFDSVNSIEISIEAVNICRYKCLFAYMRHVLFCWLSIGTFSASFLNNLPGLNVSFFMFDALLDFFVFFSMVLFYRHAQPISSFSYLPTYLPYPPTYRSSSGPLRSYSMYFSIQWVCYCFICAFMGLFSFLFFWRVYSQTSIEFQCHVEYCNDSDWKLQWNTMEYTSSRNASKIE